MVENVKAQKIDAPKEIKKDYVERKEDRRGFLSRRTLVLGEKEVQDEDRVLFLLNEGTSGANSAPVVPKIGF